MMSLAFLGTVKIHVFVHVTACTEGTELEHCFSVIKYTSGAGQIHSVFYEITTGTLDNNGRDGQKGICNAPSLTKAAALAAGFDVLYMANGVGRGFPPANDQDLLMLMWTFGVHWNR